MSPPGSAGARAPMRRLPRRIARAVVLLALAPGGPLPPCAPSYAAAPVPTAATSTTAPSSAPTGTATRTGTATSTSTVTPTGTATPTVGRSEPPRLPFPGLLPGPRGDHDLDLRIEGVDPAVAQPGQPVTVRVRVANPGHEAADAQVSLHVGAPVSGRGALDQHDDRLLPQVGQAAAVTGLAPGRATTVALTAPAEQLVQIQPYGVLPVDVTARHGDRATTLPTYLPFEQRKEYEPLTLAVAVPLTPGPDPALVGDAAAQEKAWAAQTAAGGRLDRILTGSASAPVTYAVDPALLGPVTPATDPTAPTTAPTGGPGGTTPPAATHSQTGQATVPAGTAPAAAAREAFAARLAEVVKSHPVWELPAQDPDLTALHEHAPATDVRRRLLASDGRVATRLSPVSRRRVAWPVGAITEQERRDLATDYADRPPESYVLPLASVQEPGFTGDAARHLDGTPVLGYDDQLSRLLADVTGPSAAAVTQRFLAETMTILQEFPGRERRVLMVAPRGFDPDPATLSGLLRTAGTTPWLRLGSTEVVLARAAHADAPAAALPTADPQPRDGLDPGGSPLDDERVQAVQHDLGRLDGFSAVLPTSAPAPAETRSGTLALLSTRWRGREEQWHEARGAADRQINTLLSGVAIVPPTPVNFLAETGPLQVTVENKLDVPVHDVRLRLTADAGAQRLRLPSEVSVLSIGARSRSTVKVDAEAIAAGRVVVSVELFAPDGTRLGQQDTTLTVQVQPTNGLMVLALGGAAGAVFLIGLLRTIRRNRPRVSPAELKEIDLE